jgi:ABC-2 type transport system ATP-binding protein
VAGGLATVGGVSALEVRNLSKRYGRTLAVDDLSFAVEPGRVTGFLGPNGAGKTTTMRALLGLLRPTAGSALVEGAEPATMADPLRTIGAALEATAFHPGRSGRNHLRTLAAAGRIAPSRVDEVLEMVELTGAAGRRVKGYSLGMRQRLALAAALLGQPRILILDEPANGLDPQGMRWLRDLLKAQAGEGRTVFVSSHLLAEMEQIADELIVVRGGKLVTQTSSAELAASGSVASRVRTSDVERLGAALRERGAEVRPDEDAEGAVLVSGVSNESIGDLARDLGLSIYELAPQRETLEERFLELTSDEEDEAS